jgi:cytochrome c-type biogenesis protein CcmH/NrfG
VIPALLAAVLLAQAPIVGDCAKDPEALAAQASVLLGGAPEPPASDLARARQLLRAARRSLRPRSAALDLFAADLAFAAGDTEEGGDLLASAAESDPKAPLSAGEIYLLARRAEERRRWRDAMYRYDALRRVLAAEGEPAPWIGPRIRDLELEMRAAAIAAPPSGLPAPAEARLALADGRRALARGDLAEARAKLRLALRLSPGYAEALLALSAVETRAGRPAEAIEAARDALAAEPDRVETLSSLASLLWAEPDRRAKEEAVALSDRAAELRPGEPALLRVAAERYAELGDAPRALERLERYLAKASPRERAEVASLREALARRAGGGDRKVDVAVESGSEELASEAVDRWRKAQVLSGYGDFESLAAALDLLREAERLDPSFAQAPELAAAIHRRQGDRPAAEAALRRAIRADPSRAAPREELARLYDEDPARRFDAESAWRGAAEAGSTEALFELARAAEAARRPGRALPLYRRYRSEAPTGRYADRAAAAIERLEAAETRWRASVGTLALLLLLGLGIFVYRRRSGQTLEEWLAEHPARAHRIRPVVGRLRHEAIKHGALLLPDAARRLAGSDDGEARRDAARHIAARLYGADEGEGESRTRGLVAEARSAIAELATIAREDGARLNLGRRDPAFSPLTRGLDALARARPSLERVAAGGPGADRHAARAASLLEEGARRFALASKAGIERMLDRASALPVRVEALQELLARVAVELDLPVPRLEPLGAFAREPVEAPPSVRFAPLDWETLWRNLFANALAAGRPRVPRAVRLGLSAGTRRDDATGEARLVLILADDLPGTLSAEQLRTRPAERGWGVIAEILRRNEGTFDITPPPARGFTKGIGLDLPAIEGMS